MATRSLDQSPRTVAFLVTDGFEESELTVPLARLRSERAGVKIVSPKKDTVRAWDRGTWSGDYPVDVPLLEADVDSFDALVLPGGVINADFLRMDPPAVDFVRAFFDGGNPAPLEPARRPVAAICHAPWLLIEAGVVSGRRLTSYPSLRSDLENAGAIWMDEEVVEDGGLITSRRPDDLPAFNDALVAAVRRHLSAARGRA